jgi:hypothetical protein
LPKADQTALIDYTIMSVVRPQWLKVAMIVARAEKALEGRVPPVDLRLSEQEQVAARDDFLDAIAARLQALVDAGRLEGAGNLSNWRHSEVRLPREAQ